MRHQTRIQLTFGLVVLPFIIVLALQLIFLTRFADQVRGLVNEKLQRQEAVQTAREAVLRIRSDIWDTLLFRPENRVLALARLDGQASTFYAIRRNLTAAASQAQSADLYGLDSDFRNYYLFAKDILVLPDLRAFTLKPDYTEKFQENQDNLERQLDKLNTQIKTEFDATLADLNSGLRATTYASLVFPCLAIGLALVISLALPRRITRPLQELEDVARQAAAGDYHLRAKLGKSGKADREIATLGDSFNHLLSEIQVYREHMEDLVGERTRAMEEANRELQASYDTLKETQNQLIQSEKMAALGPLVAGVAHEVNTPIGNSITASTYLESRIRTLKTNFASGNLKKTELEEFLTTTEELAKIMTTNLHKAGELVVSFKRVAVDQQSNERRQFELRSYFGEIITSHLPLLKSSPHQILNEADPNITMDTQPGAIYQILSNLITNSLRHGFRGNEPGTISIQARQTGNEVTIDYRDDGRGIATIHRQNIFDPFYTTMRNEGGSGLGLYIAFNQASGPLGGHLSLVDSPGPGVHFRLTIPRILPQSVIAN